MNSLSSCLLLLSEIIRTYSPSIVATAITVIKATITITMLVLIIITVFVGIVVIRLVISSMVAIFPAIVVGGTTSRIACHVINTITVKVVRVPVATTLLSPFLNTWHTSILVEIVVISVNFYQSHVICGASEGSNLWMWARVLHFLPMLKLSLCLFETLLILLLS